MEALEAFNSVPSADSRVLITQAADDESIRTMTHSDGRSEGGATLQNRAIDSPIPEEDEDKADGQFSDKTNHSYYSRDQWGEYEDDVAPAGRGSRQSNVTNERYDGASDTYDNESEDGRSYPDSMSMDNVSDTYSAAYEPPELKDEDFDTDLEFDDDKWLHPEKYDRDTTGLTKYLNACKEHDVTPVRYFVKHMLEADMNLGHHGLGIAAMKALAVPLESNTSIERLNLEGNWIEEEGVQYLCRVLKENVYIVELNLAENGLGNSGALCVLDLLIENRTIEWLDLSGNNITDNAGEMLGLMLKKNSTLRHLNIRHNGLGNDSAQWLMESLTDGNDSLETLDISWNHFQTRGCVLLAEALTENVGLKEVDLNMNGFGLEGALALGEAIKANRTLMRLDASYCRIPLEGAAALAYGLQVNETLQSLNVGYNSLEPDGTIALLLALERNECSGLTLLNLGISRVTTQFQQLQDKLEGERQLRVLHGGVMLDTRRREPEPRLDPMEAFKRDPMTKLKEWVEQAGYRLIDLLRHFDKDNSFTISREEFINGIKSTSIEITDDQIDILLDRLDTDGDGEIDFRPWVNEGELIQGDNEHRALKREIRQLQEDRERTLEDEPEPETSLDAFPKQLPS